jgi:hypothetical protein
MTTIEGLLEAVFSVGSVPRLYSEGPRLAENFSSKSAYEEKTRRLVFHGRQPGTQLVVSCQLTVEFYKGGYDRRT